MVFVIVEYAHRAYIVKSSDGLNQVKEHFGLEEKDVWLQGRNGVIINDVNGETGLTALSKLGG